MGKVTPAVIRAFLEYPVDVAEILDPPSIPVSVNGKPVDIPIRDDNTVSTADYIKYIFPANASIVDAEFPSLQGDYTNPRMGDSMLKDRFGSANIHEEIVDTIEVLQALADGKPMDGLRRMAIEDALEKMPRVTNALRGDLPEDRAAQQDFLRHLTKLTGEDESPEASQRITRFFNAKKGDLAMFSALEEMLRQLGRNRGVDPLAP